MIGSARTFRERLAQAAMSLMGHKAPARLMLRLPAGNYLVRHDLGRDFHLPGELDEQTIRIDRAPINDQLRTLFPKAQPFCANGSPTHWEEIGMKTYIFPITNDLREYRDTVLSALVTGPANNVEISPFGFVWLPGYGGELLEIHPQAFCKNWQVSLNCYEPEQGLS